MGYSKETLRRLKEGFCIDCETKLPLGSPMRCPACTSKNSERRRLLDSIKTRRCACGTEINKRFKYCGECKKQRSLAQRKRATRKRAEISKKQNPNVCKRCYASGSMQTHRDVKYSLCEPCFYKKTAQKHTGLSKNWKHLKEKLIQQEFRCPYTQRELFLGVNASIDHIYPQSRFPEKANELSNLEWVDRSVNETKRDRTPSEFMSLIDEIASQSIYKMSVNVEGSPHASGKNLLVALAR